MPCPKEKTSCANLQYGAVATTYQTLTKQQNIETKTDVPQIVSRIAWIRPTDRDASKCYPQIIRPALKANLNLPVCPHRKHDPQTCCYPKTMIFLQDGGFENETNDYLLSPRAINPPMPEGQNIVRKFAVWRSCRDLSSPNGTTKYKCKKHVPQIVSKIAWIRPTDRRFEMSSSNHPSCLKNQLKPMSASKAWHPNLLLY